MTKKRSMKPMAAAIGAAFVTSFATLPAGNAQENPFGVTQLSGGYMVAEKGMGEGKCGGMKNEAQQKSDKEGACAGMKKAKEGKNGEKVTGKGKEGKCGEGKCGGNKK